MTQWLLFRLKPIFALAIKYFFLVSVTPHYYSAFPFLCMCKVCEKAKAKYSDEKISHRLSEAEYAIKI